MRSISLGLFLLCCVTQSAWADDQKPSLVNGVSATSISSSSIRVTWNKPWDNVGVKGYNVYRNGFYYATVFNTNFIDEGLNANETYRYGIVAFDDARNFTSVSSEADATTSGGSNNNSEAAPPPPEPEADNGTVNRPDGLYGEIIDGNQAKVKWRAPSGNVRGYNVYKDNSYVATVFTPEYTAKDLGWGRDYRFQVVAFNFSSQFSNKSDVLTVNTANGASTETSNDSSAQAATTTVSQPQNDAGSDNGSAPDGYRLVFSDEFNGYNLDSSKWNSRYRWGPGWTINGEKQYYVDRINNPDFGHSPFSFDGNHMTISAIKTPEHLRSSANWQPYLSGALTTYNKFKMKYGYVEMRAQLPKGKGLWSAFWLLHQNDNDRRPEIDVVEYIGSQPNKVYNTYHHYENWQLKSTPSFEAPGADYSQAFHTYAVKWEPGKITWYVDGQERNSHSNGNVAWEDMYLLVNLAVGGWWPGDPDGNTQFPANMKIDYIRAYQK